MLKMDEVKKFEIAGKKLYIIDNVVSESICNEIITKSETSKPLGKVQSTPSSYHRIAFDHEDLRIFIMKTIEKYIPLSGEIRIGDELRYNKYFVNDFINIHIDSINIDSSKVNPLTVTIYLNENFTGGETIFYDDDKKEVMRVKPKTGTVTIFDPSIFHSGDCVLTGTKSIIRACVYQPWY